MSAAKNYLILGIICTAVILAVGFASFSFAAISGTYFDFGTRKISNALDPTNDTDAATKNYVDTHKVFR